MKIFLEFLIIKVSGVLKLKIYPDSILPKPGYLNIISIDSILAGKNIYALRRSNYSFEDTFSRLGEEFVLKEDALTSSQVLDLSMNLMGGDFLESYLKFIPKMNSRATKKWDGKERVFIYENLKNYNVSDNCTAIYFDIKSIHDKQIPYKQNMTKVLEKILKERTSKIRYEDGSVVGLNGQTKVVHDPINLNYWHIELKIKDFQDQEIPYGKKSAWVKDLCEQTLKNILTVNACPYPNSDIERIDRIYYQK